MAPSVRRRLCSPSPGPDERLGRSLLAGRPGRRLTFRERVAGGWVARFEPGPEPALALRRRSVRKQSRVDRLAGGLPLEVVTDQGRSPELLFEVADGQLIAGVRGVGPDTGQAVGLQLDSHRTCVSAGRVRLIGRRDAPIDAEQLLDVVAEFVTYDVGLRKPAQPGMPREHVEEANVEVNPVVSGAVERTGVLLKATAGVDTRGEDRKSRRPVRHAGGAELAIPEVLDIVERRLEERTVYCGGVGRRRRRCTVAAGALGNDLRSWPESDPSDTVDVVDVCVAAGVDVVECRDDPQPTATRAPPSNAIASALLRRHKRV